MRSKGGFTLFIIIAIVALVVSVGVGGFLMFREKNARVSQESLSLQESPIKLTEESKNRVNTLDIEKFLNVDIDIGETLLFKKEADFDGDEIKEIAFVSFYNLSEKYGEYRPYDFAARVGILKFNYQKKEWGLVFDDKKELVYESKSGKGIVENFEIVDFNQDKKKELLVSIRSSGTGGYRSWFIVAFVDNKIQIIKRSLPTEFYEEKGFEGHNTISIVDNFIQEEFPVYLPGDSNCCPQGGTQYLYFKFDGLQLVLEKSEVKK